MNAITFKQWRSVLKSKFSTGVKPMTAFQIPVGRSNHWAIGGRGEHGHLLGSYMCDIEDLNVIATLKCNKLLRVITFGLKWNKLLSLITLGLKCNNVIPTSSGTSLTCYWLLVAWCVTSLKKWVKTYFSCWTCQEWGDFSSLGLLQCNIDVSANRVYTVRSGWLQNWTSVAELRFGKSTKYERSKDWNLRYSVQII